MGEGFYSQIINKCPYKGPKSFYREVDTVYLDPLFKLNVNFRTLMFSLLSLSRKTKDFQFQILLSSILLVVRELGNRFFKEFEGFTFRRPPSPFGGLPYLSDLKQVQI